jgi:hypothetical protein
MLNEKQRSGALMLGLLGFGGTAVYASRMPHLTSLLAIALAIAVVILCLSDESRKKPSLRYATVIFVVFLPVAAYLHGGQSVCSSLVRFWPVMMLLISVSLFRQSVNRSGLSDAICRRLLTKSRPVGNTMRVSLAGAALTVLSGQGSIALICTSLSKHVKNKLAIGTITNRALCASMYVLPTTIASAAVASAIPHLDTAAVLLLGAPLTVAALFGSMVPTLELSPETADGNTPTASGKGGELAIVVTVAAALVFHLSRQMTVAFAGAMAVGYLYDVLFISRKRAVNAVLAESVKSLDTITPELLLLAASGLLILTIGGMQLPERFPGFFAMLASSPLSCLIVLVMALPLLTVAGIHPLILFGTLFPVLTPALSSNTAVVYLGWISMFVMANLLSPVSICSIVAAASLKSTSQDTSYRSHWRFCLALAVFTVAYLAYVMAGRG